MSVSAISPSVNVNPQVQQKNNSKVISPAIGIGAGAITGAGLSALINYREKASEIKKTSQYIDKLQKSVSDWKFELSGETRDFMKKHLENSIKEHETIIKAQKTELTTLKQALKPMKMLKSVVKSPITFVLAATGLAIGLYVNHKNKNAEPPKNEGLNCQV